MPVKKAQPSAANLHAVVGSDEAEVKRTAAELAATLSPAGAGEFVLPQIRRHKFVQFVPCTQTNDELPPLISCVITCQSW